MWVLGQQMLDGAGGPTHDFWEGASFNMGQLLPFPTARNREEPGWTDPHRMREMVYAGTPPDRVEIRAFITPVGKEVLDDLVAEGYLDAAVAAQVPRFEMRAAALTWRAADNEPCIGGGVPLP